MNIKELIVEEVKSFLKERPYMPGTPIRWKKKETKINDNLTIKKGAMGSIVGYEPTADQKGRYLVEIANKDGNSVKVFAVKADFECMDEMYGYKPSRDYYEYVLNQIEGKKTINDVKPRKY